MLCIVPERLAASPQPRPDGGLLVVRFENWHVTCESTVLYINKSVADS